MILRVCLSAKKKKRTNGECEQCNRNQQKSSSLLTLPPLPFHPLVIQVVKQMKKKQEQQQYLGEFFLDKKKF